MVEKKARNIFQKHTNSAGKKCWEKIKKRWEIVRAKNVGKKRRKKFRKNDFNIHTNIVTKNGGEKRAKQFFQKHTNSTRKICWGKNR